MAADLRRSTKWAGLQPGDPVRVEGTRLRGAAWQFVAHVTNGDTGEHGAVSGWQDGLRHLFHERRERLTRALGEQCEHWRMKGVVKATAITTLIL